MITITHNATNITNEVDIAGLSIVDERNSTRDTLRFSVTAMPGGFSPQLDAEIIITRDSVRIFGGTIVAYETRVEAPPVVVFEVECVDFTRQADRKLITERFTGQSVNQIIETLRDTYAPSFTINGVDAAQVVASISFNRLTLSQCLDKLAKLDNSNWYIDYHKDIHFFGRNAESAPFSLTDTSGNFIFSSLKVRQDLSQLRNVVEVIGGEVPTSPRSTLHAGDGETTEFPTNFKFATLPTVLVDGVEQIVGTEYLDTEGFDCYWSFNEKYVRFDDTAIPPAPSSGTTNIEITGAPLVPLVAVVPDADSIALYGEYEFSLETPTITSQSQIIERGLAEIEAYANELVEASFDTYEPGLRSGQVLNITSTLHGVSADYVVKQVEFRPYANDSGIDGVWSVTLVSAATMSLVDALRALLQQEKLQDDQQEVLLAFYRFTDLAGVADTVDTPETTQRPYYLADEDGIVSAGSPFICNFAVLEA